MTAAGAHAHSGRRRSDAYKRLFSTIFIRPLLYVVVEYDARGCRKCRSAFSVRISFVCNLPRQYHSCDPADRECQSMGVPVNLRQGAPQASLARCGKWFSSRVLYSIGEVFFIAASIKYGVRLQSQPDLLFAGAAKKAQSENRGLSSASVRSLIGRTGTSGLRHLCHCPVQAVPGRHTG